MRVFLIRHPRPAVAAGICYGQTDLALAEGVAACAARLKGQLPPDATIYTSPLRRCLELAKALCPTPRADPRLGEMHFGDWEMRSWDNIGRQALDDWAADPLDHVPPGGESVAMLRQRVVDFMAERQAEGHQTLVLVTHAGVMKVLSGLALGLAEADWLRLQFDYGELVQIG
ncbi:alpha-ribazole phosphatase [Denitratisoma oestradiolicum]|uniref:Alpha-ribazole phosphatase n=1 Tax=Denitratisoma oestradiolicum TaxID=311182 RepID=A0A6S6XP62_9PROT|nr:alpha-ribazole phosphatase [Denitratisoma oestradiolicum]TWO81075.1 alpha-ribazole phosphatase [Denitratisoma oestradiolicum]CAB1367751.1 Phosphoglycerate/bisphosphoglycerate mutase [Denitratisoma oestradiolicum]